MVSRSFNGQDNSRTGTALHNQRRERLSWFFMRVYNRTTATKISSTKSHFPAVESSFYLRQEVLLDGQLTKSGLKQRGIREPYRIAGIKAPDTSSEGAISIFADQGKVKETGFYRSVADNIIAAGHTFIVFASQRRRHRRRTDWSTLKLKNCRIYRKLVFQFSKLNYHNLSEKRGNEVPQNRGNVEYFSALHMYSCIV